MADRTVRENLRALPFEDVKRAMQYMKQHVPAAVYMRACGIANANAFNAIREHTVVGGAGEEPAVPQSMAEILRVPNRGVPNKTVEDKVRFPFEFDRVKHDLDYDTDDKINAMPQCELLHAISNAIEEIFPDEPEEEPLLTHPVEPHPSTLRRPYTPPMFRDPHGFTNGFADDDIPF